MRSCKKATWNILGSETLKEEQLTTIICSEGKLLNNRPLTASNSNAADLEAPTLNHSILGRFSIDDPNVVFYGGSVAIKNVFWAHSQFMKNVGDRCMKEYLPQLTPKKKWANEEKRPMAVGDLVWVCDKQYHPFNYPMEKLWSFPLVTIMYPDQRQ